MTTYGEICLNIFGYSQMWFNKYIIMYIYIYIHIRIIIHSFMHSFIRHSVIHSYIHTYIFMYIYIYISSFFYGKRSRRFLVQAHRAARSPPAGLRGDRGRLPGDDQRPGHRVTLEKCWEMVAKNGDFSRFEPEKWVISADLSYKYWD